MEDIWYSVMFFSIWFIWSIIGRNKKYSLIISVGGGFLFGIVFLIVIIVLTGRADFSSVKSEVKVDNPDNITICIMARGYVEDKLKAPRTAKFPLCSKAIISKGDSKKYTVISYVDSKNSFGAMLRSNYEVELEYLGNERWNLINIKVE